MYSFIRTHARFLVAMSIALSAPLSWAEPFEIDPVPAEFDGVVHPWTDARRPVSADFDGDGQDSWYAGGNRLAHSRTPTQDPARFSISTLPSISLQVCPACTAEGMAFVVGDVNRDGRPDIVRYLRWVGQSEIYTLQAYLSTGGNNFSLGDRRDITLTPFNSGDEYMQMRMADYDNDGDLDIAMLYTFAFTDHDASPVIERGNLRVRWNTNGTFGTEAVLQSSQFDNEARLLSGDFDRDGDTDLLVNRSVIWVADGSSVSSVRSRVFTNPGDGTFQASNDQSFVGNSPNEPLFFADTNRDSAPEWFVHDDQIRRRIYDLDNGWSATWFPYTTVEGDGTYFDFDVSLPVVAADLNEDAIADLVVAKGLPNGAPKNLVLHYSTGAGNSLVSQLITTFASDITQIGVGDIRGDGDQDLLVRLRNGSFHSVRNTAQRTTLEAGTSQPINVLTGLTRIAAIDGNRDGITDLYALKPLASGSHLEQMLGTGGIGFSQPTFKILVNTPSDFALGDFNGDTRPDFAYTVPNANAVRLVTQNDSGFFGWTDTKIADYDGADVISAGQVAIHDHDLDLFVGSNVNGGLLALRNSNSASSWSSSNPRNSFVPAANALKVLPRFSGVGDSPIACAADGVAFSARAYSVALGWAQSAQLTQVQNVPQSGICGTANMDNDVDMELIFVTSTGALAWWNPTNTPASPIELIDTAPPSNIRSINCTDWNGDGRADLLVASASGLYLYSLDRSPSVWARLQLISGNVLDAAAVDINRDTRPDVAYITAQGVQTIFNASRVALTGTGTALGSPAVIQPGQSRIVYTRDIINPGVPTEDANIAVTSVRLYFRKATFNGNTLIPGNYMTRAEVEQAVASISILMDDVLIGSAGTAAVLADGSLTVSHNPVLGNIVSILPGATKALQFRVTLKATAGNASYSEFMLDSLGDQDQVRVLQGVQPTGKQDIINTAPYVGIRISNTLFANGFE